MTVADEEKSLPKRLAIFQRTRELSKRDFYIYYQKSLLWIFSMKFISVTFISETMSASRENWRICWIFSLPQLVPLPIQKSWGSRFRMQSWLCKILHPVRLLPAGWGKTHPGNTTFSQNWWFLQKDCRYQGYHCSLLWWIWDSDYEYLWFSAESQKPGAIISKHIMNYIMSHP